MYAPNPINQRIQSGDDEDEARYDAVTDDKAPIQESFLSFYNHNFQDLTPKSSLNPKSVDFACFNATSSNPFKFSYDSLIQDGFDLSSPKKKRKSDAVDGGAGGRVVRATGRKDRHSKVRTARGPRDRRVRLSPTTAIQFYDVQDRLGYDRPSKAIDWLINEAKTAIDALDQHQIKFSESNAAELSLSQTGMREKQEDSGFSCFVDEAAPSATALEAYLALDQYGFCSALNSTPQMFGGGGAEYSHINSQLPAAQPISDDANLIREPLQSSTIINNSSSINNYFAGFRFSNELSKIADSAIPSMKN